MASVLAPPNPIHIAVYNTLNIVGFLANFSITLTAYFSRRIHRSRNWYLAMMTWTWWNIPYLLLMLGGHQLDVKTVPVAPRALCTIQAALIYSGPPTVAFANLGVIGHIASLLIETLYEKTGLSNKVSRSVGIDDLSKVTRNATGAYCGIDNPLP
ncbi:hypothetical protein DL96DRAFT_1563301 [Flagelloscypha sp. PMI_526]|nr:hypothetical protein DL96DRAFT_1563301 [Flagelloscypha sp. PMI_526]